MKEGDKEHKAEMRRLSERGFIHVPQPYAPRTALIVLRVLELPNLPLETEGGLQAFTTAEGFSVLEVILAAAAVIRSDQGLGEAHNIRAMTFQEIAQTFMHLPELFHEFSAAQRLGAHDADLWLILKDGLPQPPPVDRLKEEPPCPKKTSTPASSASPASSNPSRIRS